MRKLRGEAYAYSAGRKSKLLDYPKYNLYELQISRVYTINRLQLILEKNKIKNFILLIPYSD